MAMLASLLILGTVVAGLVLMSLSDQVYRNLDRRVLIARCTPASGELA
jgi:hypothetical protein